MTFAGKGRLLALVNVVVIAIAWGWLVADRRYPGYVESLIQAALFVGLPVGAVVGTWLGRLAGRLSDQRRRTLVVLAVAVACVMTCPAYVVAAPFIDEPTFWDLWSLTLVPTSVAALVLEQWARPEPPLPVAFRR